MEDFTENVLRRIKESNDKDSLFEYISDSIQEQYEQMKIECVYFEQGWLKIAEKYPHINLDMNKHFREQDLVIERLVEQGKNIQERIPISDLELLCNEWEKKRKEASRCIENIRGRIGSKLDLIAQSGYLPPPRMIRSTRFIQASLRLSHFRRSFSYFFRYKTNSLITFLKSRCLSIDIVSFYPKYNKLYLLGDKCRKWVKQLFR